MPGYIVGIRVQYPAGTNLANVNATCRIESTNDSKEKTSSSVGEIVWNLGDLNNFPKRFSIGDQVTVTSIYQGFEQTFSFAIPGIGQSVTVTDYSGITVGTATGGGLSGNLVLVAKAVAPSLRYFVIQDILDYYNLKLYSEDQENGIKPQQIVSIGTDVEREIDELTGQKWDNNKGAYYSQTEYIDTNEDEPFFFLSNTPVSSITNLYTTDALEKDSPNSPDYPTQWDSLTEDTEYILEDVNTGRIVIVNSANQPGTRKRGAYAIYKSGQTTPTDIKRLAILMTARTLMHTAIGKATMEGREFEVTIDRMQKEIDKIIVARTKPQILNT